jgi:hypothetical protein
MNSKRLVLVLSILGSCCLKSSAQDSVTAFLGRHLVGIHELESATYQVKKKHGKIETTTNYYADSLDAFRIGERRFLLYKFGSYSDHMRPHFALLKADNHTENCIIDCENIADDINAVLAYLKKCQASFKETENSQIRVLRAITKNYPTFY